MTKPTANYVPEATGDLLHELSRRLDSFWRYDQYIANCDGQVELREYWLQIKLQESRTIEALKKLIKQRAVNGQF